MLVAYGVKGDGSRQWGKTAPSAFLHKPLDVTRRPRRPCGGLHGMGRLLSPSVRSDRVLPEIAPGLGGSAAECWLEVPRLRLLLHLQISGGPSRRGVRAPAPGAVLFPAPVFPWQDKWQTDRGRAAGP